MNFLQVGSNDRNVRIGPRILGNGGGGIVIDDGYSTSTYLQAGNLVLAGSSGGSLTYSDDGISDGNCTISFKNNIINGFDMYVYGFNSNKLSYTLKDIYTSKQDKITPTAELDLTSIDTADIESLRSIVKALATELNTLGLIKLKSAEETA